MAAQVTGGNGLGHFHGLMDGARDRARDPPGKGAAHQDGKQAQGDHQGARRYDALIYVGTAGLHHLSLQLDNANDGGLHRIERWQCFLDQDPVGLGLVFFGQQLADIAEGLDVATAFFLEVGKQAFALVGVRQRFKNLHRVVDALLVGFNVLIDGACLSGILRKEQLHGAARMAPLMLLAASALAQSFSTICVVLLPMPDRLDNTSMTSAAIMTNTSAKPAPIRVPIFMFAIFIAVLVDSIEDVYLRLIGRRRKCFMENIKID